MPKNYDHISKQYIELVQILEQLRGAEGCPWDLKQTHESLVSYLLEETYEVIDAIERKNNTDLAEELGDLLL
ncbi:MAG: nucleotide pyrophosphohydrolase, partial [Deltaproteobacteria bacterium]|nr:nucleotide pyrophosphohydrolase [Deltaproteobacteria bacterium]